MPFDWQTPTNFLFYQIIWTIIFQVNGSIYDAIISLNVGTCLYLVAYCNDFKASINHLNELVTEAFITKKHPSAEDLAEITLLFNDIIEFHCRIRE